MAYGKPAGENSRRGAARNVEQSVPLFIVGLQKSGTSLLSRCLQMDPEVSSPFKAEGHDFWGDVPPFAPTGYPTGERYQAAQGRRGHLLDGGDVDGAVISTMRDRWDALPRQTPIILNKNPFNSVRLEWLRRLFPEARIVAVLRQPIANTYSLTKKYLPHKGRGMAPEQGWWGVKPPGWQRLVSPDKVQQCARQWAAINGILLAQAGQVDLFVPYGEFCRHPRDWLMRILRLCRPGRPLGPFEELTPLSSCDDEFRSGAPLRSSNRYFRERGSLALPEARPIELPPLTDRQIAWIEAETQPLWRQMRQLCHFT